MYQIDNSTAAVAIPASTAPGTAGFFTDGNPATGFAPTIVPAEYLNMLMMEMLNVIVAAGVTPSKSTFTQLTTSIKALAKQSTILTDTGTAGAYAAANSPALTALPTTGFVQRVNIANPNPGASTYSPDGLAARPVYGLGLQPLQGGELSAGIAVLMYLVQAGVNSGNGAWIIIESLGGPGQVPAATKSQHAAQLGQVQSGSWIEGLIGANNATTPNTQFDFSALSVTLRNPTSGAMAVVANTGTITNNILTAGPAANGRDQAGAFTASTWVHFYFIWNGTTLATISSAALPSVGPTLPPGYTSWAYIGAVYLSAGSVLAAGSFRGSWFHYSVTQAILSNGTAGSFTAISLLTVTPPNALQNKILVAGIGVTANGSGTYSASVTLQPAAGVSGFSAGLAGTAGASLSQQISGQVAILPNFSQSILYAVGFTAGAAPTANLNLQGYSVPNGGE